MVLNQFAMQIAMADPLIPSSNFIIKAQQRSKCSKLVRPVASTIGKTMFWVCRNLVMQRRRALAERLGIKYLAYIWASAATSLFWWRRTRIGSKYTQIMDTGILITMRTSMAPWVCTPSMWYCFAPYDWPQNVSSALDRPIYAKWIINISQKD